jgi:large subunit ribosomal protein LP1
VQEEKLNKVIKASGNEVEGYWAGLFTKALKGQDITKLLANVGTAAPAAAGPAGAAADAGAAEAAPARKLLLHSLRRHDVEAEHMCP